MSILFTYSDIDLSLVPNIYKDVPVLYDVNDIKNTLYNNLMISSFERFFDNNIRMDINDLVHQEDNFLTRKQLEDAVIEAANMDSRILKISDIVINSIPEEFQWDINFNLMLDLKQNNGGLINLSLVLNRD